MIGNSWTPLEALVNHRVWLNVHFAIKHVNFHSLKRMPKCLFVKIILN